MKRDYPITDEWLTTLGFKKIDTDWRNRDEELLQDYKKYPLLTTTKVKFNSLKVNDETPHFELGMGRYLQKCANGGYLLLLYDVANEYVGRKETIQLCGPFWVTSVFTIKELKKLLDVLHVDYSNYKINKYIKENLCSDTQK